jgi:hypothetical protein
MLNDASYMLDIETTGDLMIYRNDGRQTFVGVSALFPFSGGSSRDSDNPSHSISMDLPW